MPAVRRSSDDDRRDGDDVDPARGTYIVWLRGDEWEFEALASYLDRGIELPLADEIYGLAALMEWAGKNLNMGGGSVLSEAAIDRIARSLLRKENTRER
jgi:hypothetical protein